MLYRRSKDSAMHSGIYAALLLASGLFSGCQADDVRPAVIEPEEAALEEAFMTGDITGHWVWVRSVHRTSGETLTPESQGYSARLTLSGRPSGGAYEYERSDGVSVSGEFSVGYEDDPRVLLVIWEPVFENHHSMQWLGVGERGMHLTDSAAEGGYESFWRRTP